MAKITWSEQYRHPLWQRKRLEAMEAANFECQNCGDKETTLNVHHKRYVKGRMVWEYSLEELSVLCEPCHQEEHSIKDEMAEIIFRVPAVEVASLLAGFYYHLEDIDEEVKHRLWNADPLTLHVGLCAHLVSQLSIEQIAEVAAFVASLSRANSEARPLAERWFGGLRKNKDS